jgi:hypothetical protein
MEFLLIIGRQLERKIIWDKMKEAHVVNATFKIKVSDENDTGMGKRRRTVMMPKEVRIADNSRKQNDSEDW